MIPNISAILSDFQAIGKGLVKTVELMTLWIDEDFKKMIYVSIKMERERWFKTFFSLSLRLIIVFYFPTDAAHTFFWKYINHLSI